MSILKLVCQSIVSDGQSHKDGRMSTVAIAYHNRDKVNRFDEIPNDFATDNLCGGDRAFGLHFVGVVAGKKRRCEEEESILAACWK